jgi:cation diffusion facilitator CzcD-associated flavoprotein CzcO
LSRPALPDIPGLADFKGKVFHSARWDRTFDLAGKTVAVVGTGASAIQIVPAIADKVGHLHLYQRTPPWVLPKPDRDITARERALFRRIPLLQDVARKAIYFGLEWRAAAFVLEPRILKWAQPQVLRYLAKCVPDRALREKLTPSYTMGCKRILMSNDYYQSLQRGNVDVVTDGIERVRAHSIVTKDGVERPVDAIVLATGFQAAEGISPFEVRGAGGVDLDQAWREGAEAYLGTSVSGFPNLFFIVGPNTGLGHNSMVFMIESQIAYILSAIRTMRARGLRAVDVKRDHQTRYNAKLHTRLARTVWAKGGCVSWYNTRTGKNTTLWPGFTLEFRLRTRRFDPAPYDLVPEERGASLASAAERRAHAAREAGISANGASHRAPEDLG